MNERIFIKIGGSFLTDKNRSESLNENNVRKIAEALKLAVQQQQVQFVLAHGAGAYGHIIAQKYNAQQGIHPRYQWKAFYQIRQDMIRMNLRFVQLCGEQNLFPITIQPSAIINAKNGNIESMYLNTIEQLLNTGQIPLLHGDIVFDEKRGFTIASTEDILTYISRHLKFNRAIMISDVEGVYDSQRKIIPIINAKNYEQFIDHATGAKGVDVTGGMRQKVEQLFNLLKKGFIQKAVIASGNLEIEALKNLFLDKTKTGTLLTI